MELTQVLIVAGLSLIISVPAVLLIPRARQSTLFDRVLWVSTWFLAAIGASLAPRYINPIAPNWVVAGLAIIPTVAGAMAGALSINFILWLLDRLEKPIDQDSETMDELENGNADE